MQAASPVARCRLVLGHAVVEAYCNGVGGIGIILFYPQPSGSSESSLKKKTKDSETTKRAFMTGDFSCLRLRWKISH